jgi:coenzyme F420-reducing hydrogenase delta subunit
MCTGRVDLAFVLRAFEKGADGVIVGGCWPGECHYVTEGNYDALGNMHLGKKLLEHLGVNPDRVRLEWIAASEGTRFAEIMSDFVSQSKAMGRLGAGEGIEEAALQRKLAAASQLVPYIKLVEREKLRVPTRTEEAYNEHFNSDRVSQLFNDLVADKLAVSQILLLLGDGPLSTGEIATQMGLTSSDVAKHMNSSSSRGLVRYDCEHGSYALARAN